MLFHLGGAVGDVAEGATAYPHRRSAHSLNINGVWLPEQSGDHEIAWTRALFQALGPTSAAYLNFLDRDDTDRITAAYGKTTYRRLAAIKASYDPENVFHLNHNIAPAPPEPWPPAQIAEPSQRSRLGPSR